MGNKVENEVQCWQVQDDAQLQYGLMGSELADREEGFGVLGPFSSLLNFLNLHLSKWQSSGMYKTDPVQATDMKFTKELPHMLHFMPSKLLHWSYVNILIVWQQSVNTATQQPPWTAWRFMESLCLLTYHKLDFTNWEWPKIHHELWFASQFVFIPNVWTAVFLFSYSNQGRWDCCWDVHMILAS